MTHMRSLVGAAALSIAFAASLSGQTQTTIQAQIPADTLGSAIAAAAKNATTADPPATMTVTNRPIIELRATVLGRPPSMRVNGVVERLQRMLDQHPDSIVSTQA